MKHPYSTPEAVAQHLLGRPFSDLDEDEQHVLRHVVSRHVELQDDERLAIHASYGDRLADRVAAVGGSWGFIISFMLVLVLWALLNNDHVAALLGIKAWDSYPFIFLNLMLSMLAAIQAPVIMMSQNRQSIKDRIYNRHDYEVNLRTTIEILKLHQKIDRLTQDVAAMRQGGTTPD
ncbi:DUF1003 domain-containing protein [Novosphingobium umbonatum]|uniref:DUF1003 domain-containing protein n=1 Tax=Novosphingobium umbonatum TaxID=1908524 RepID=A0A3S2V8I4_9SPHN|nr:DUF1003 domain-containing protein [Novosphingobium umbonatum]RVU06347.1 DUF1003 domain-containing protein [Novosphingobium umbonatum]